MDAGARALLSGMGRAMVAARHGGPVELAEAWRCEYAELCRSDGHGSPDAQLAAIEHAALVTADEIPSIAGDLAAAADLSTAEQERLCQHLAMAPAHIARQTAAILRHALPGNTLATVLPLDVHGDAARSDLVRRLMPGAPRYRAGQDVPGRPGWTFSAFLGAGAQGEVWCVTHPEHAEPQAMKLCHDEAQAEPLRREARNLATLRHTLGDHPNIVGIREVGVASSPAWIAMEVVRGGTLEDWIRARGPSYEPKAIAVWRRVCGGIAAAHTRGLVHRDLKPANILLELDGTPKIADFGIGAMATPTLATLVTRALSGLGQGTDVYASPEQRAGAPADPADDVHALGVILFQMLAGSPRAAPPHHLARAFEGFARQPSIATLAIIEECLDTRAHRPANANALLLLLDAAGSRRPEPARAPSALATASGKARRLGRHLRAAVARPLAWGVRSPAVHGCMILLTLGAAGWMWSPPRTATPRAQFHGAVPVPPPSLPLRSASGEIEVAGFRFLGRRQFSCPNDVEGPRQFEVCVYRCEAMYQAIRAGLAPGDPAIDTEFVLLPPLGRSMRFTMGSPAGEAYREYDEDLLEVMITPFLIARTELTQRVFSGLGAKAGRPTRFPGDPMRPREELTWDEASELAERLGLRLPNEAQWEFACRGGTRTAYPFGNTVPADVGTSHRDPFATRPVATASSSANAFGLFDMNASVWEWCDDYAGFAPLGWARWHPMRGGHSVPWVGWLTRSADRSRGQDAPASRSTGVRFTGRVR